MTDEFFLKIEELSGLELSDRFSKILALTQEALKQPVVPPSPLKSRDEAHRMAELMRQIYGPEVMTVARKIADNAGSTFSRAVLQALEWHKREQARQEVLAAFHILGTPPEPAFDDLVNLAAYVCETPVAAITFIAGEYQLFKSIFGYSDAPLPIADTLCAKILDEPGLVEFRDLEADPIACTYGFVVNEPHARFYASVPLQSPEGPIIGRLCVVDMAARADGLTAKQKTLLEGLARQVMVQMVLRKMLMNK